MPVFSHRRLDIWIFVKSEPMPLIKSYSSFFRESSGNSTSRTTFPAFCLASSSNIFPPIPLFLAFSLTAKCSIKTNSANSQTAKMPEALPRFLHRAAHIFLHPEVFAALPFSSLICWKTLFHNTINFFKITSIQLFKTNHFLSLSSSYFDPDHA